MARASSKSSGFENEAKVRARRRFDPKRHLTQEEWLALNRELATFYFVTGIMLAVLAFGLGLLIGLEVA